MLLSHATIPLFYTVVLPIRNYTLALPCASNQFRYLSNTTYYLLLLPISATELLYHGTQQPRTATLCRLEGAELISVDPK